MTTTEFYSIIMLILMTQSIIPKMARYTAIGNHIWFGDFISSITERIGSEWLRNLITKVSYWKLLVCIPCNVYWLTVLIGLVLALIFSAQPFHYMMCAIIPLAFMAYINENEDD